jgi:hypothetical protein
MSGFVTHELALKVTGPDGAILWVGVGPLGMVYEVMMVSVAMVPGQVVVADPTNTIIPRMDYVAADTIPKQLLRGLQGTATVTLGATLGVAIDKCASDAAGIQIRVAGTGSIVAVETTVSPGTVGHYCNRATAGQVTPAATVTALIGCGVLAKVSNIAGGSGNKIGMLVSLF